MAKGKLHSASEAGFNMTPMIDCTFQLIIFFILASQTANKAYAKNVQVPRPENSQSVPVTKMNVPKVTINIVSADARGDRPDDFLAAAAASCYVIEGKEYPVGDGDELVTMIKNRKAESKTLLGVGNEKDETAEFFVEIRADKRVNWQDVAPAIRAAVTAGISKMNITALTQQ